MFKSENLLHEVMPVEGYQRFAVTTWFSHVVEKPSNADKEILDPNGLIFVGIPAYRDPELEPTVRSLIEEAKHPEKLRIGIFIQASRDEDLATCFVDGLKEQYPKLIKTHEVHYTEAKNVFYARHMVQRLFEGETFAL